MRLKEFKHGVCVCASLTSLLFIYLFLFLLMADPKHPNCLRIIKVTSDGMTADISGTDGTPGCPPDGSGKPWNLQGKIEGNDILVDFTPKGGPANLKGILRNDKIEWPDGNAWTNIKTPVRKIPTW